MDTQRFFGGDGAELVFREAGEGEGRPLIMLPGFAGGGARMFEYGRGGAFGIRGRRVVVPDFRGHGDSARPHDRGAYPADVLADDVLALVRHLGFADGEYDLGGYSLGGRVVVRALVRGARPRRAVVAGQGLAKVCGPQTGGSNHRMLTALVAGDELEAGSAEARMAQWLETLGADPQALLLVLESLVATSEEELAAISVPTLVVIGDADERSDADQLAVRMGDARFVMVPGDHGGAFSSPELAAAVSGFLAGE
ncbi:MAG TPA: alpha/beta hydrolase [Actinospica sp.]|nr:alpha/beta hydrolase [Actinospica sp.]